MIRFFAALAGILALYALAAVRYRPPPARPADAPAAEFSGVRARLAFEKALGEQTPHPVGSDHDTAIRERLFSQLRDLGYRPEVIEGVACGSNRGCARVRNIVARREGTEKGPAVWFNCHYDSVWAGPAVSDNGAGVSAGLEIARALAAEPPHKRTIALLFNEGEENGLLGAEALVKQKAFLDDVYAVINLEARGTGGPSLMFETSPGSAGLIDLYARVIPRPASNSIYYFVYSKLPNDTDLTVFKRAGLAGYGFAFIGGTARYHTPLDDLAHGDVRSVQHQGENALALLRGLADTDVPVRSGEAFFFDVFSFFVVHGPVLLLQLLTLLAIAIFIWQLRTRRILPGALAFLSCVIGAAAVAYGVLALLHPPYFWLAHPAPIRALFVVLPLAVTAGIWSLWRIAPDDLWAGAWAVLLLVAIPLVFVAPAVPYFIVLPALFVRWRIVATLLAAALLMPIAWLLYDALGSVMLPASAALLALLFTLALACAQRNCGRACAGVSGVLSLVLLIAAFIVKPFSPDNPKHENVVLLADTDAHTTRWLVEGSNAIEPAFRKLAQFGAAPQAPLEWLPNYKVFVAPGPRVAVEAPRLEGVHFEGTTIRATLTSPRGGRRAGIWVPSDRVRALRFAGEEPHALTSKNRLARSPYAPKGMTDLRWETMTGEGVPVEIQLDSGAPVDVIVFDQKAGLPPEAAPFLAARPAEACQIQDGDRTLAFRHIHLAH